MTLDACSSFLLALLPLYNERLCRVVEMNQFSIFKVVWVLDFFSVV